MNVAMKMVIVKSIVIFSQIHVEGVEKNNNA